MAFAHFTPYVSEFEYSSRFHPSKNPHCPTSGWADDAERDFGSRRYRRSPEEGSPVGQEPSIEVRAILVRCPKTSEETDDIPISRNVYNITAGRSHDILDFHGFDRDEPAHHSEVRDCRRKLIVTMKFNNIGRTKTQEEFVVIDHVLDPITMHKARLLNPFVVKVRQEPVLQLYGLKFQGVVNAEAREEVINKKWSNFTGCDDASDNPTCGQMIFEGKPIPYSQGFCCSCDPELNVQRQASLLNESVVSSLPSFFSKSRDVPIRPFKSPRSVDTDIRTFADSDETEDIAYSDQPGKEDVPRFSRESLANPKSAKIGEDFVMIGYDNLTIDGSHNDEQDLVKLKRTKIKKENRPIWKTIFGEADDKKTIAPQVVFSPPGSSRQRSDSSGSDDKNPEFSLSPRKKSFRPKTEFRSSGREVFSNYRSTTGRYRSPYQNQRSVNLAAELTRLEEDYKNVRLSSMMRAVERNNEPARASNQAGTRIGNDYRQEHSSTLEEMPSPEDRFHSLGPTLSVDVKLAIRPNEKSTIPPSSSTAHFSDTCSRRTSHPVTTTPSSSPDTRTPAVLRQKLVSDRVYPSGLRANVSLEDSHRTEATAILSQKLDGYVADLLADAVMLTNNENPFSNDSKTNPEEIFRETSFVNSITGSSVAIEGTAKHLHGTEYPGTNVDNLSDRVEENDPIFEFDTQRPAVLRPKLIGDRVNPSGLRADVSLEDSHRTEATAILSQKLDGYVADLLADAVMLTNDENPFSNNSETNPEEIYRETSFVNSITGSSVPFEGTAKHLHLHGTEYPGTNVDNLSDRVDENDRMLEFDTRTSAVLRPKLVGDHSHPTEAAAILSQKLDGYVADLLADAVMLTNDENPFSDDTATTPEEIYRETSFVNSITESSVPFEGTAKYLHGTEYPGTNIDNLSDRAESPSDSSPSFSSGNISRENAILVSGSLKNQLANWLPHEERNTSALKSAVSESKEQHDVDPTTAPEETDDGAEGQVRYEDRSTTLAERRPVQVYLGSHEEFDSSAVRDDEKVAENPRQRKEKSPNIFLDYPSPEAMIDLAPKGRSRHRSASRSYRSIAEDNALFVKDKDRQRSIDKRIDDEFIDISDALKDVADCPKIVREKPESESVVRKFATMFGKDIEARTELLKHTEPFLEPVSGVMLTTGHRIVVDRFKIVNDFQEMPAARTKLPLLPASTDWVTNPPVRMRDRKRGFPATSPPESVSRHRNARRSYRSIAENDALFVKDNDRQRSIDKRIDDEFVEISDALKEAADGPKIVREKPKSESTFEQDDSVVRKFATMFGKDIEARTELLKHTEPLLEPVSGVKLTTGHRIVVDRFKIVNDFQEIPAARTKLPLLPASTDWVTNPPVRMRDRKQGFPATSPPESATTIGNETLTRSTSEILETANYRTMADRLELVEDFNAVLGRRPAHERTSTQPSSPEVSPNSISTAKADVVATVGTGISHRNAPSPVLTIEKLKKELRKEVERYSSISPSGSGLGELRGHRVPYNEVREVNTELTPAEKVEDLITDEETLPPDEETKHTTDALSKTTQFPNSVRIPMTSSAERSAIGEDTFTRLGIERFDARFVNTGHALPLKRANELLVLLEEPSRSSSQRGPRRGDKRIHTRKKMLLVQPSSARVSGNQLKLLPQRNVVAANPSMTPLYMQGIARSRVRILVADQIIYSEVSMKRRHRHRDRRYDRHKKLSIKSKRDIGDRTTVRYIVGGGSENEDDEHPWYDATTKSEATRAKDRSDDATIVPVARTTQRNRRRRSDLATPADSRDPNDDRQASQSSNDPKLRFPAGRFYVSITRIPENENRASPAGLRIEEIPKVTLEESNLGSHPDEAMISSAKWPDNSSKVDKMPKVTLEESNLGSDPDEAMISSAKLTDNSSKVDEMPKVTLEKSNLGSDPDEAMISSAKLTDNSSKVDKMPKVTLEKSNLGSDPDEAMISSAKWPDNSSEVDEMPIFRDTKHLGLDDGPDGREAGEKVPEPIGRSKRNLQTYPARNSPKNERTVDGGARGEDVGRNNKRNYPMDSFESEPEAQIFYDYEDSEAGSAAAGGNDENSRSPGNVVRKEVNPASDKKYLGGVGENSDSWSVKSSEIMRRGPDRRLIVGRRGSKSVNHRLDGRSEGEGEEGGVSNNAELFPEDIVTESSASLEAEERGRGHCSGNQFGVEPSDGWKEKMELLKLKKHADVLKEYLNWRQDVAPPESPGTPGYTTMISPTSPKEEQTSDFFTTDNVQASDDASAVSSAPSTDSTVSDGFSSTSEQRTDVTDFTSAHDDRYAANGTTISGSVETSVIPGADDRSSICLGDSSTTTVKAQTSTGCPANKTAESFRHEDETSTGRILPPCGYQNGAVCVTEHENVSRSSTRNQAHHQARLSDIDRDLIIISVLEKNLLKNKSRFHSTKQDGRSELHRARDNAESARILQQHHRRHKSKKSELPVRKIKKIRHNRRAGRQLMALEEPDERNNAEENDPMLGYDDDDRYFDPSSGKNTSYGDGSDEWSQKWNRIIDKIIHENSSRPWKSANSSGSSLKEMPVDSRSALQRLHVKNADKYIRQIAKNIVRNTNIHDRKSKKDRPSTRRGASRRKLQSYPMARRKIVRKADNVGDFGNYEAERSAPRVRSMIDDSCSARGDSPDRHPAPRSADAIASSPKESSEQEKSGRDFAISLSGKIHVEGGTNGRPMSISFDTAPEIASGNVSAHAHQNGTSTFDNGTKTDGEAAPSTNFLSSLFNIASVPKDQPRHPQEESANSSAGAPIRQSVRDVDGETSRHSRDNGRQEFASLSGKYPKVRKSRAVDEVALERLARHRDDRSYDVGRSRESEDLDEADELEDYPESSDDDNYSDLADYDRRPLVSAERRSLNSRDSCPEMIGSPAAEHRSLNRPEVKVIRIIPLNAPESHASLSSMVSKHQDAKASRMTASQLPKTEDDTVPGTTVKPGKIEPADLPGRGTEDEDASNPMLDTAEETDFPPKSSGTCSSGGSGDEPDARNDSPNDLISTDSPVSLRVIGLVGMRKPAGDSTGNANVNSDPNYAIVPLVHVKIEQQTQDGEGPASGNMADGGPGFEATNPPEPPCPKSNMQGEEETRGPEVATMSMDNDEELREPIDIGSCPGSNRKDVENPKDYSNDRKLDRTQQPEAVSPLMGNRETTPKTRLEDAPVGSDSRKEIRMKNMLAIMGFMKKIKEIMNGEEAPELSGRDDKDIVIKLDRVIVLPNNRSYETRKKIGQPEETTDRVVMMGEGVRHGASANGIYFEKNFNLSESKGSNGAASPQKIGAYFNETDSGNGSSGANWRTSESDRDKSFLFYGGSDKVGGLNRSAVKESRDRELSPIDRRNENHDRPNEEDASEGTHRHKIRLIDMLKDSRKVVDPDNNEDNFSPRSFADSSNPSAVPNDSESRDGVRNFEGKFDDRLRSLKNRELDGKGRRVDSFSLIPKTKRHRSPTRLRSDRMGYDLRKERDAKSQIYRRRSLPTGREVSRFSGRKFGRFAVKGVPKEKRAKKKKKKKRRRRKKKKKKRRKGKSRGEAAVKGKAWWPFGRQLMSASEGRQIISDSSFDRSQLERIKTKRHRDRRVSSTFAARGGRRVHRAKIPHERNKKKRRKHKKGKRRKKKKKTKGRKDEKKSRSRSKRQIRPGGTQVRGGQDCMDRRHPPNVNPAKYLESAHCLRFSDMWYSVYELESPITEHTVYLQLFEKHSLEDGTTHWDDLTQGTMVRMGTFTRHQKDSKPTIVFTYSGAKTESQKRALNLDPAKQRLLVPSPVPPKKSSQYREVRGGSGEYLVVQSNTISKDGNDCDKAGVGFAAFSKQEDRCGRAKGSCLRNQPLAYWRHDTEARESGRRGCYFLSNFASVPTNPIKYNVSGSGSREYLGLEYHSAHVSAIDIEVRTDYNAIVRVGSSGRVTEVYVDSTALEHTVVTVVISNMGLTSSPYQPRITDCPTGLPVSWTRAKGIMQVIPPQHDQRVTLDLYGQLSINGFHCSVEVVNHRGELVAMRRIRVQKMDRCFCVWHCLCACIGSVSGMGCQPMSPEHYHAAGFQGPVPVVTTETSILMNAVKDVLMLSALLVLLLLLLGILKWFVGMFVPAVGRWGLDSLLEGSRIEKYLEPELKCRCVVTDDDGAPVHPDTGQRTVRICSRKLEFVLNLIFFLTYPIAICCSYFRRSLNASRQRKCCPDESKMCLINEKGNCPKMICVSTYGDSRNSKLEAEDTRYVMNELKKSQESLENPKRTKKKDGHRNGSGKNLSKKSSHKNRSASDVSAKRFVDDLLKRRTVFRNLTEPVGGLLVPAGTAYCLRGYFLNAEDGGYRFITPCPFKQHWLIVNNQKKASKPPEIYPSNHFMRSFGTARDVYESNELSLTPQGICVNVQYLEDR